MFFSYNLNIKMLYSKNCIFFYSKVIFLLEFSSLRFATVNTTSRHTNLISIVIIFECYGMII